MAVVWLWYDASQKCTEDDRIEASPFMQSLSTAVYVLFLSWWWWLYISGGCSVVWASKQASNLEWSPTPTDPVKIQRMTFVEWSECVDGLDRIDSTDTKLFIPVLFSIEVYQFSQSLSTGTASLASIVLMMTIHLWGKIGWCHYNPNDPTTKQSMTFVEPCNWFTVHLIL